MTLTNGNIAALATNATARVVLNAIGARFGRQRSWPPRSLLLEEPVALAEERTSRLRRLYSKAVHSAWDAEEVFRELMHRHGGIQLSDEQRRALVHPLSLLMWGELAAWNVAAELAERLEDADARMAASSQVFDEARHFYALRDYVAALHVPVPELEPYFAIAVRRLLPQEDLTVKLFAMQILAEGTATAAFHFLRESEIDPVLSGLLELIAKDEARHVALGVTYLPERLARMSTDELVRVRRTIFGIGELFGLSVVRQARHYEALGLDPRELIRRADRMLTEIGQKLGTIPGTDTPYFRFDDPSDPSYEVKLQTLFPEEAQATWISRVILGLIDAGARVLPS
jgi:hypothetical protein